MTYNIEIKMPTNEIALTLIGASSARTASVSYVTQAVQNGGTVNIAGITDMFIHLIFTGTGSVTMTLPNGLTAGQLLIASVESSGQVAFTGLSGDISPNLGKMYMWNGAKWVIVQ